MEPTEVVNINNENLKLDFDNIKINTVLSVNPAKSSDTVYDLKVNNNENYHVAGLGLVHNGGKRAGAFTVSVPVWHRDIEDFLEIQSENGDQRKKAHDIFPQIAVHDLYMEAVTSGADWHTFCPHEVKTVLGLELYGCSNDVFADRYQQALDAYKAKKLKLVSKYNAKDFMKKIMRTQFETGLPYLFFVDTVNRVNPNKHEGHIPCGNLCQESFSNVVPDQYAHTCNLASLVVGRLKTLDEVMYVSRITTRILDNGISLTLPPINISKEHNNRYRTIGIGVQGLHDYLALNYTTYNDLDTIAKLAETIEYGAVLESVELAKTRGAYPAFSGSMWDTGEMTSNFANNSKCGYDWQSLQTDIKAHGIRNSQLFSPAPNCQDPENPVNVYNKNGGIVSKSLYDILKEQSIDVSLIEQIGQQTWIELPIPIKVPTYAGDDLVTRIWYNGKVDSLIEIKFADGNTYQFTPNHKLLVNRDGVEDWCRCDEIKQDDTVVNRTYTKQIEVVNENGKFIPVDRGYRPNTSLSVVKNVVTVAGKHTYDFEVLENHHYLMGNGVVSHNTSSSIFMDAGAGVMPVYSAFFREDNSTGKFPVAAMHLKTNPLCYSKTFGKHNQADLTKSVAALQQFVDTGISAEYLFDQNNVDFSAKTLYDTIIAAWENGTKSVYYVRSIKKGSSIEDLLGIKDEGCVGCSG